MVGENMINEEMILVTDSTSRKIKAGVSDTVLQNNAISFNRIYKDISQCVKGSYIYVNVKVFAREAHKLKNCVIFPMSNQLGVSEELLKVTGVCEREGLRFIGPSGTVHMLCNDRSLTKMHAQELGIRSFISVLIRNIRNKQKILSTISNLKLPLMITPNTKQYSSVKQIAFSYEQAVVLICKLHKQYRKPVLVEEFIEGDNVEVIMVGNKNRVMFSQELRTTGITATGEKNMFLKKSNLISANDMRKLHTLFRSFEKTDYMQIIGKIYNGEFYLTEIISNSYLGYGSDFWYAFKENGYSMQDMFEMIIKNGLSYYTR